MARGRRPPRRGRAMAAGLTTVIALLVAACAHGPVRGPRVSLVTLYSFAGSPRGAWPTAGLLQARDGDFYGTTTRGGVHDQGMVFRVTPSGAETVVYSFAGTPDGADPEAGLIQDDDGSFYGTTSAGGAGNKGTVFKIAPDGAESVLHSFTGRPDGEDPVAGLVQAEDGGCYGATMAGGANDQGTVFEITPGGAEAILHSFAGTGDGRHPSSTLIQGKDGSFYGTTAGGGARNDGTVFKITPAGAESVLYSFAGRPDGDAPRSGLIQAGDGNFYGTTQAGGAKDEGALFKIGAGGAESVLYSFAGQRDGRGPQSTLIQALDGNFYGTTWLGGNTGGGTIFRVTPEGAESVLHSFVGRRDGALPQAGLIQGKDGSLYGTTWIEGVAGRGIVFKITLGGVETILCSFGGRDAHSPWGDLIRGQDGDYYGTTHSGGGLGLGSVFKITPSGSEFVVHSFAGMPDGAFPFGGLIRCSDGNLYGTTYGGGVKDRGTVFRITPSGAESVLYTFRGSPDGANPAAGLTDAGDGVLYGTTRHGGTHKRGRELLGDGTVFRITQAGVESVVCSFGRSAVDGMLPAGHTVRARDGTLYGTTEMGGVHNRGTCFTIAPGGAPSVLYAFGASASDGARPSGDLTEAGDGRFYGTTRVGGAGNNGTVFKITPDGAESVIYSFQGSPDGAYPNAGLLQAADGSLYGTAAGGAHNRGTVFEVTPAGAEWVLYSFGGAPDDGAGPTSGLARGADGYVYGTTWRGGAYGVGTVFRLTGLR